MGSQFPNSKDVFSQVKNYKTKILAEHILEIQSAALAIENSLGTIAKEEGTFSKRVSDNEADIGKIKLQIAKLFEQPVLSMRDKTYVSTMLGSFNGTYSITQELMPEDEIDRYRYLVTSGVAFENLQIYSLIVNTNNPEVNGKYAWNISVPQHGALINILDVGEIVRIDINGADRTHTVVFNGNPEEFTWDELNTLAATSALKPGSFYILRDYQTIYTQPNRNVVKIGIYDADTITEQQLESQTEPLLLMAATPKAFYREAYSLKHPNDILEYSFTNVSVDQSGRIRPGLIVRRTDTINNISLPCDWRRMKWARKTSQLKDIEGAQIVMNVNDDAWNEYLTFAGTGGDSISNINIDDNYTIDGFDGVGLPKYFDTIFFGAAENISAGHNFLGNNFGACINNKFGDNCYLNTIGECDSNIIDNNFQRNICYSTFSHNKISHYCTDNILTRKRSTFQHNNIKEYFSQNAITADEYNNNSIDSYFISNEINCDKFINNIIGANAKDNIIDIYHANNGTPLYGDFSDNNISTYFTDNEISSSFQNNNIAYNCNHNTFNWSFTFNNIGNNFMENDIFNLYNSVDIGNDGCTNNFIGNSCMHNTFYQILDQNNIGDNFKNNTINALMRNNNILSWFTDNDIIATGEFSKNDIRNEFQNNNFIGYDLSKNTIGSRFQLNNIYLNVVDNAALDGSFLDNNIGANMQSNDITSNFIHNAIGSRFMYNSICMDRNMQTEKPYDFSHNRIGDSFGAIVEGSEDNPDSRKNIISNKFHDNSIGNYFCKNTIEAPFMHNQISNNFTDNEIFEGSLFQNNFIDNSFSGNHIYSSFDRNRINNYFINNVLHGRFDENQIGDSMHDNFLEPPFENILVGMSHNTIGKDFANNHLFCNFNQNLIGVFFASNTIGEGQKYSDRIWMGGMFVTTERASSFSGNKIGDYFGNNLQPNIITKDFSQNDIGDQCRGNTIECEFLGNVIKNDFGRNQFKIPTWYTTEEPPIVGPAGSTTTTLSIVAQNNRIGSGFWQNIIEIAFKDNEIGNDFALNEIGHEKGPDTIIQEFSHNIVGDKFGYYVNYGSLDPNYKNVLLWGATNNVIGSGCHKNRFYYLSNNKIGDSFVNNKQWSNIEDIECIFEENIIGNSFSNNNLHTDRFSYNTIGALFQNNDIGSEAGEEATTTIIVRFSYNTIGLNMSQNDIKCANFKENKIGSDFTNNPISIILTNSGEITGGDFSKNTIGDSFSTNTIVSHFTDNIIGISFKNNIIDCRYTSGATSMSESFSHNNVGTNAANNTIKMSFNNNDIGNYYCYNKLQATRSNNTPPLLFTDNKIGNKFGYSEAGSFEGQNIINVSFLRNSIGDRFRKNTINNEYGLGISFSDNTIGSSFIENQLNINFQYNDIRDVFQNNTLSVTNNLGFIGNSVAGFFSYNTISGYMSSNSFEAGFSENLLYDAANCYFTKNIKAVKFGNKFNNVRVMSNISGTSKFSRKDISSYTDLYNQTQTLEINRKPNSTGLSGYYATWRDSNQAQQFLNL